MYRIFSKHKTGKFIHINEKSLIEIQIVFGYFLCVLNYAMRSNKNQLYQPGDFDFSEDHG